MPRSLLHAALVAFALALFAPAVRAQACTTSWVNPAGGAWSFAPNWDAGVPDAADHACITLNGTYTVTVGYFHVDQLTLGRFSGGQQTLVASAGFWLDTPSTIRLTGVLEWTDGYFTGGTTLTNRGLILLTGPTATRGIEDAGTVLRNEGTVTHAGSGRFNSHYDALVENAGLWNFTANGLISGSGGVTGTFTNEPTGIVRKSLGLGTTSINGITFRNLGTLDVLNGTLQLSGTSIHTLATLRASAGATLRLIGDQTFVGDHGGDIEGTLELSADFAGVAGASWAFTGSGIEWQSGDLRAGTITNTGLVYLNCSFYPDVSGVGTVFRNEGTVEQDGSMFDLDISGGARVENADLWKLTDSAGLASTSGTGTFVNEPGAIFRKTGVETATIAGSDLVFENGGTLNVQGGTLLFEEPSSHTDATFNVPLAGTLRFESDVAFEGTIGGALGGALILLADMEALAGGATWAFTGTGAVEWESGTLTDGTLTSTGLVRLIGASTDRGVDDAVFRNQGTVEHEGTGRFTASDGGRVENESLWSVTASGDLFGVASGGGTFVNEAGAIFRKAGPGTASVASNSLEFENSGELDVQDGTLLFQRSSSHTSATLNVTAGATLRFDASVTFNGTIGGLVSGTLAITEDFSAIPGAAMTTWAFTGTGIEWAGGAHTGGRITNTGLVRLTGAPVGSGVTGAGAVFRNEGTVEHESTGTFNLSGSARVENAGLWELTGEGRIAGTVPGAVSRFVNEGPGTLHKRNAGTAVLDGSFLRIENEGAVRVNAGGEIRVDAPFDHQAGALVWGSGTFDVRGSAVTHDGDTEPGSAIGLLTWQGDFAPGDQATYVADISGPTPGTEHDQLVVEGTAALAGTLRVAYLYGYVPAPGAQFRLLTCTVACSGTFDTVVLPAGAVGRLVYSDRAVDYYADPEPTYTVTAPAAGARWAYGEKYSIKWSGPGVPDAAQYARIFLVDGVHAPVEIALVKNKGSFKFKDITDALPPGTTYRVRVELDGDPAVYGLSEPFTIYDPAETFVFTSPVAGETYARGTTQTVTWTSPDAAAGPVVLTFLRVATPVFSVTIPNTGTYSYAVPASGIVSSHYFTIRDADEPLYFGQSENVVIGRFQVTDPVQTDVWAAGSTQTVAWAGPNLNSSGTLKVLLKRKGFDNTTLATLVPYAAGSVSVTVPDVAPAGDYYVTLVYSLGAGAPLTVNSLEFTVTGGSPRVAAASAPSHVAPPTGVEDWTELSVSAPSLADGAEVGAFAGDVLLGVGRVSGGVATVWVPGTYVDAEGDAASVAVGAPLTLRAYEDGAEVALAVGSVTSGTSGETAALAVAAGDVLFVVVGGPGGSAPETASTVALPTETALLAPFPNPAAGRVAVRYELAEAASVRVTVYDALGRAVAVVADEAREAGRYEASVDASRLAPGVYVVRLTAGPFAATQRITVVR